MNPSAKTSFFHIVGYVSAIAVGAVVTLVTLTRWNQQETLFTLKLGFAPYAPVQIRFDEIPGSLSERFVFLLSIEPKDERRLGYPVVFRAIDAVADSPLDDVALIPPDYFHNRPQTIVTSHTKLAMLEVIAERVAVGERPRIQSVDGLIEILKRAPLVADALTNALQSELIVSGELDAVRNHLPEILRATRAALEQLEQFSKRTQRNDSNEKQTTK